MQGQEGEADLTGARALEGAGESGAGLVSFFENFRAQEVFSDARRYPYFRSHPLSSQRIESMRRNQNTNGFWMSELQDAQTDPERLPTLRSALSDMESATPADLQAVARKYLVPSEAYRIQVTPRAQAEAEASTE